MSFPAATGSPVSIVLHPEAPGLTIPKTFQGISIRTTMFTNPKYLTTDNTQLLNLIKNLGEGGCFRFGGGGVVFNGEERQPNTEKDVLTTSDIDRVAAFIKATHWNAIYGFDLALNNASLAAQEAQYVTKALGNQLIGFQFGNEPNDAKWGTSPHYDNYDEYQTKWNNYYAAIKDVLPGASFAGPDASANKKGQQFITSFGAAQNSKVNLLTGHYFPNPLGEAGVTTTALLVKDETLVNYLSILQTTGSQGNLKYRITETNTNTSKQSNEGVSNGFVSSLWALDYMWTLVEHGCQGVNFQSGSNFSTAKGRYYYGMLAFKQGAVGRIIPADIANSGNVNCTAHASFFNEVEYLTVVNKDSINAAAITVTPNKSASSVLVMRLLAPSLNATTDVTFGGSSVNADGTFQIQTIENYGLSGQTNFIVNVPAGSAAVIQIK